MDKSVQKAVENIEEYLPLGKYKKLVTAIIQCVYSEAKIDEFFAYQKILYPKHKNNEHMTEEQLIERERMSKGVIRSESTIL